MNVETGKRIDFTIMPAEQKVHGTAFRGVLNLDQIAPVIMDGTEIYVDRGALHAKSKVERRVKWVAKAEVPQGKAYWLIWVAVAPHGEEGPYFHGMAACSMWIDHDAHRGYKNLAEHVNRMDKALKGEFILDELPTERREALGRFLREEYPSYWENSSAQLQAFLT